MTADPAAPRNSDKHVSPQPGIVHCNDSSNAGYAHNSVTQGIQPELGAQASGASEEGLKPYSAAVSSQGGLSAQAALNSPASNPRHKSKSEEFISVPVSKLEQLTELFAQVLRESRELQTSQPDLEKGLPPDELHVHATGIEPNTRRSDSVDLFGIKDKLQKFDFELDSASSQQIEEVWVKVKPWKLVPVSPGMGEEFLSQVNIQQWQNLNNLPLDRPVVDHVHGKVDGDRVWKEIYTNLLKSRNTKGKYYNDLSQAMAVCLIAANQQDHVTFGYILDCCYRSGALRQPDNYLGHIFEVLRCFLAINDIYDFELLRIQLNHSNAYGDLYRGGSSDVDRVTWHLTTRNSLEEVLGIQISDFFRILHIIKLDASKAKSVPKDSAGGHTFRIDDLNIRTLKSIGKLSIRWSCAFEDHLKLDTRYRTLDIFYNTLAPENSAMATWQGRLLFNLPGTFADRPIDSVLRLPDSHEYASPNHEIVRSWAILFTTDSRSKKRALDHDELIPGAGTAAKDFLHKDAINLHLGRSTALNTSYNFTYRKTQNAALQKDELPYSDFPLFETRLRQHRHYMDTQKPRGLRQLWRDNRDSLNYFTFWGVIIFGTSSMFLALFSLAVGIAQTVASFKSLALAS